MPRIFRTLLLLVLLPILLMLLLFGLPRAGAGEDPAPKPLKAPVGGVARPALLEEARQIIRDRRADAEPVAEFPEDRDWLNVSRPLSFAKDLRGKVVVLDFWCYCCINCMHVLPDLEYLEQKYAGQAFAVVGVHSAKFENERDLGQIREAVRRYEIKHPVVNDFDFRVWNAFGARSWPTFAVVTPDGRLLGLLAGEGRRELLDALVYALLEQAEPKGGLDPTPLPIHLEADARTPSELAYPGKLLADAKRSRLFVADSNHNRVLELTLSGAFVRAFGDGQRGLRDGPAGAARFDQPQGLALKDDGLYVADTSNHALRRIDLGTGQVETLAGDGRQGHLRQGAHPARGARLSSPWDLEWVKGLLYVAMAGTHQLWVYDPEAKEIERLAGDGTETRKDASDLTRAGFAQPSGLTYDGKRLYVADSESSSIVAVGLAGPVRTLAGALPSKPRDLFHFGDQDGTGPGRRFQHPLDVEAVGGTLYVADTYNHKLKRLDPATGRVTTWLGTGLSGFSDKPPTFNEPSGLSAAGGRLYVADTNNHAIRVVQLADGSVTTLRLQGVPIPQPAARAGGVGAAWPELPGTEQVLGGHVTLRAGAATELVVSLVLPEGWKLTPEAPSALRVEGKPLDQTLARKIDAARSVVSLPALPAGTHQLRLRLLYYVCQDAGSCRIRSADIALEVECTPKGPTQASIEDAFRP